jgi:uncharacterized protein YfbU (UPF0304 family)
MLCEIQEHLKLKGDTNTELIKEAIYSGNLWGLEWGMSGVFHDEETPPEVVSETCRILTMWERLEQSFKSLKPAEQEWLDQTVKPFGKDVEFPGFDGNVESEYISAADFLVQHLGRFQPFKGRDLNGHFPSIDMHRRMLPSFEKIYNQVLNKNFTVAQIAEVLKLQKHPDSD